MKESGLVQRVRESWKRVGAPKHVVVGFSGGADSTALLAALKSVVPNLHAVHIDHGVRDESVNEAKRAIAMVDSLEIPISGTRLEPGIADRYSGLGSEEAMRRERYLAIAEVAVSINSSVIALAHHAQDQAETVLLHILRGSGLAGAIGMRERSEVQIPWWEHTERPPFAIWRPLLETHPDELRVYLQHLGLDWIEDASNADERYRRNAIRHSVLPELERVVPGAIGSLARFGALVADEDALLQEIASIHVGIAPELSTAAIVDAPSALRRRVVRSWLQQRIPHVEVSRERIEAVIEAAVANRGSKRIELSNGFAVVVSRGVLIVTSDA